MLDLWIVAVAAGLDAQRPAAGTKTCPDRSVVQVGDSCVQLPDHRTQFSLPPPVMRLTTEWTCGTSGAWSSASVRLADKPVAGPSGETFQHAAHEVQLLSLTVGGRQASSDDLENVGAALAPLGRLADFRGVCFGTQPALFIKGFERVGDRERERTVTVELG